MTVSLPPDVYVLSFFFTFVGPTYDEEYVSLLAATQRCAWHVCQVYTSGSAPRKLRSREYVQCAFTSSCSYSFLPRWSQHRFTVIVIWHGTEDNSETGTFLWLVDLDGTNTCSSGSSGSSSSTVPPHVWSRAAAGARHGTAI